MVLFGSVSMNIIDDKGFIKEDNDKQFIFHIQGVNMEDIALGLDKDLEHLVPNKKLCSLAYIEKVREDNTELIFRFAYEYLKLNFLAATSPCFVFLQWTWRYFITFTTTMFLAKSGKAMLS
jgi:hypothetical protein